MRRSFWRSIVAVPVAVSVMAAAASAWAQNVFEQLVTPGDLVQSHAKYEKTCESCHEAFSKSSQRRLCLECHKDIAADVAAQKGFHGKRHDIQKGECKSCHTDHKGRAFDIVQFDRETFDHAMTDFKLSGAHVTAKCSGCHAEKEKFSKAPSRCFSCHEKADIHKGALGQECASCHIDAAWNKPKPFDHGKTKFPLEGAHQKAACAGCHAGERYKDLPRTCSSCHDMQDVHQGNFGKKCETCHGTEKWVTIRFDHDKQTKFPLHGAHAPPLKCAACHKGDMSKEKLAVTCVSCHKANDPHKGELGSKCESCHNETSWRKRVEFDHDLTKFPLIGLHAAVPCESCHRSTVYKDAASVCSACHEDRVHKGTLGANCASCHNPNGWALWRFNHDRQTKFSLTGAHTGLQCSACHSQPGQAGKPAPLARECVDCHRGDDAHRGTFGSKCQTCHTTETFRQRSAR